MRNIVWFSCGAASAVALKIATKTLKKVEAVYCDTGGEHEDNLRFLLDVQNWCNITVKINRSVRFNDHLDCCEKLNYWGNLQGAPCTVNLKKKVREDYQRPGDVHIFGYTIDEKLRALGFEMRNVGLKTKWILIENKIDKASCLSIIKRAGIELPKMYKLGYDHNNCIGCVKGGMGYWNKIRIDFPDVFDKVAKLERKMGKSILLDKKQPLYLDLLDPGRGNYKTEPDIRCDIFCHNIINILI
jgi:hypothetical protein